MALKTKKEKLLSHFGPQAHVFPWPACFFLLPALAQHQESAQSHAPPLSPTHGLLGAFPPLASARPSFPAACFARPLRHSPARPASAPRPSPAPRSASAFSTHRFSLPLRYWPRQSAGPACQRCHRLPFLSPPRLLSFSLPRRWRGQTRQAAAAIAHARQVPKSPRSHAYKAPSRMLSFSLFPAALKQLTAVGEFPLPEH